MINADINIQEWVEERNAALITMDVEKFKEFYNKWRLLGVYQQPLPSSDTVLMASMCKMICNITTMPPDVVGKAKSWLSAHGMDTSM